MNSSDRFKPFAAVYIFLIRDNKILLLQRQNTGYRDGDFDVPAGHLEDNETATQAAVREVKEEAMVYIDEKNLQFTNVMHRKSRGFGNRLYFDFYFIAEKWTGEPQIGEPDKCSHIGWFNLDNLPQNFIEYQKEALELGQKGISYSEWGWE